MFLLASDGAPGRPNEDYAAVSPEIAVVVDGAGVPLGGCSHGVAWYARELATRTLGVLVSNPAMSLADGLAGGIQFVASMHAHTCDLTDPGTPCAAVAILRLGTESVEALSLSDATVVVEVDNAAQVLCDQAIERICSSEPEALEGLRFGTPEHAAALNQLMKCQTEYRNQNDGWWVAAAEPSAAYHAETLAVPRSLLSRAVVLTDGATRPVDQMRLYEWRQYLDMLDDRSPAGLIEQVRDIEKSDPDGRRFPRTKLHDDATIAQFVGGV